jgi:hypothetical protein
MMGLSLSASAFFPYGAWNENQQLRFIKWPLNAMDTNHDGDIAGPDEGVPYFIEEGNLGWDNGERVIVQESFDVWQNVPTAYVAFRLMGTLTNPRPGEVQDKLNTISLAFEGEEESGLVGGGILGVTVFNFIVDDGVVDPGIQVTGGQFIEADIVIDAVAVREGVPGVTAEFSLKDIMVHEIGHFIGIDHTPLNNLVDLGTEENPFFADPPVLTLREPTGQLVQVGATPTMFPIYFETDDGTAIRGGGATLAPDDIAAVSFIYPRGSQSDRFGIFRDVRDQSSGVLPSVPIAGAHIVAWADADDNPGTARVPLISTMSALYADELDPSGRGRFELLGLPKQLETFGLAEPFYVTYTFTSSPLDGSGVEFQAPPGYAPVDFDSTHIGGTGGRAYSLETDFYAETFHENGNVFGVDKYSVGTPLVFDPARQKPVSTVTGLTLDSILAGFQPMFGDALNQCPLNLAAAGLKTTHGNDFMRGVRDNWLRKTTAGVALVDTYYSVAPSAARFMVAHPTVWRIGHVTMWLVEQAFTHGRSLILLALVGAAGGLTLRWRRRKAVATAIVLAVSILGLSFSAHAYTYLWGTADLVGAADEVISGRVTSVETRLNERGQPVTDIQISVTGKAVGSLNKGTNLYLEQLGGRVGDIVTQVSEFPTFRQDEELVLYLTYRPSFGRYSVTGGSRGKYTVARDAKSGQSYVLGVEQTVIKRLGAAKSTDGRTGVPLDSYLDYVRGLAEGLENH